MRSRSSRVASKFSATARSACSASRFTGADPNSEPSRRYQSQPGDPGASNDGYPLSGLHARGTKDATRYQESTSRISRMSSRAVYSEGGPKLTVKTDHYWCCLGQLAGERYPALPIDFDEGLDQARFVPALIRSRLVAGS